jgi:hypothetical protein
MAVAANNGPMRASEADIAVLSRIQRENREAANALVSLIQAASPERGVGENISVHR